MVDRSYWCIDRVDSWKRQSRAQPLGPCFQLATRPAIWILGNLEGHFLMNLPFISLIKLVINYHYLLV